MNDTELCIINGEDCEKKMKALELQITEMNIRLTKLEDDFYDSDSDETSDSDSESSEEEDEEDKPTQIQLKKKEPDTSSFFEKSDSPSMILRYQDPLTPIVPVFLNNNLVFYADSLDSAISQCHELFNSYKSKNIQDKFLVEESVISENNQTITTITLLKENKFVFTQYHRVEHVFAIYEPIYKIKLPQN